MALSLTNAKNFLKNDMYNTTDKLARESTKPTGNNYYINSANGLFYTVMRKVDSTIARAQLNQAVALKREFKPGVPLYSMWADVLHDNWKRKMKTHMAFRDTTEYTWGSLVDGDVVINIADGDKRSKTENKLNLKCLYAISKALQYRRTGSQSYLTDAQDVYSDILEMFDDNEGGYVDDVDEYRESYKQGLVKMCSRMPELKSVGSYQEASGMWDDTLQGPNGGIYMRYIRDGSDNIVNNGSTFENTESTTCIILGYDSDNFKI